MDDVLGEIKAFTRGRILHGSGEGAVTHIGPSLRPENESSSSALPSS